PRSGAYVAYPQDSRCRYTPVEITHHWNMPPFNGTYSTASLQPGTWQAAADVALDPFLMGMAGAEWATGIGLNRSFTLLYPEAIILDDDLYHRARYAMSKIEISADTLALDTMRAVGPGGHFLAQKHTRKHMRTAMVPAITQQPGPDGKYRDPLEVAREKVEWILHNHKPEPLEDAQKAELTRILKAADKELG
ncbi:MAG: hypothetical protein GY824_06665, partial [Delftia sp.]|nr:hypothetical protein [Delftia sp.]